MITLMITMITIFPLRQADAAQSPEGYFCTNTYVKGRLSIVGASIVSFIRGEVVFRSFEKRSFFIMTKVSSTYILQSFGEITANANLSNLFKTASSMRP